MSKTEARARARREAAEAMEETRLAEQAAADAEWAARWAR